MRSSPASSEREDDLVPPIKEEVESIADSEEGTIRMAAEPDNDPEIGSLNAHLNLCSIQKRPPNSTEEDYSLRALPFALKGEANTWLLRLPANSISSWVDFRLLFLDYFFQSNKTNAIKKEILACRQDYDEVLSQYWSRFKGLLDSCPNNRMCEVGVYNIFYEWANPESKDLLNSSSRGNFTKKRVSEAREILGRLIDAKNAYDSPRTILKRGSVDTVNVQSEDRIDARIEAGESNSDCLREEQFPRPRREDQATARWSDNDPNLPPTQQSNNYSNPQERQPNWVNRNPEGNNCGNRQQNDQPNWANRNQNNPASSYVPPHQRNYQGNHQNSQPNHQNQQGQNPHYHNTGGPGNFRPNQGHGPNHPQGPNTSQPSTRQPKNIDELNEQKTAMGMLAKQLSQIATSLSKMRGNEGIIPALVKPPDRANISQITLRSG
ncbi:uncharacterized protein LOC121772613 [Salvia splendens]|uniref:uncharacterized protein LOC121772613 n=1 Tax=Salvia splendens TaxID=180675 RepID=UPI001C26A559|nr:uncharacterized protein LOC121772613 [Salvia splendens]